jgi:amidase
MNPTGMTAREMLAALTARRLSAAELLDAHLARHERVHPRINAIVATDIERAKRDAAAIDEARAQGRSLGALAGLPMTIKDGFDVEGLPATAGFPPLANRPKDCADADLVARLRAEGAVIWGKSNVPLMLGDFQTYNPIYGTTNNPYDISRTPGGSSGGAAAALASFVTPLEIGSDIGGSLRHPANFCGVFSLKPTWGSLSLRGHVPPFPDAFCETDLGVAGPMARNTADLQLLWGVLAQPRSPALPRDVRGIRIAVWDEEPEYPLSIDVQRTVRRAAEAFAEAGATVEREKPPVEGADLLDTYLSLLWPILAAGLPSSLFDGFAAGRAADVKALAEGAPRFSLASFRARATAPYRDVQAAQVRRLAMKDRVAAFFDRFDAILCPISPVVAFRHMQEPSPADRTIEVNGARYPYFAMMSWIALATACHLPAMAVPAGQTDDGLPVGVQFITKWNDEARLFDLARVIEARLGGFRPPPEG